VNGSVDSITCMITERCMLQVAYPPNVRWQRSTRIVVAAVPTMKG
jgi:hypothetical protein